MLYLKHTPAFRKYIVYTAGPQIPVRLSISPRQDKDVLVEVLSYMGSDAEFGHHRPKVDVLPCKRVRYLFIGIGYAQSP